MNGDSKKQAVIDLGSNSVLLTVADSDTVLHDEARVVALGKGLGAGGAFDSARMEATLSALRDYASIAEALGVPRGEVKGIATSASRRASNAEAFYARVLNETGLRFRIISGQEEAFASHDGAKGGLGFDPTARLFTLDLGGGSTEMLIGDHGRTFWWSSVPLGSARLTEDFLGENGPGIEAMKAHIRETLSNVPLIFPCEAVVAMAGTATTLGAIDAGLKTWKPERVHGRPLTRKALNDLVLRLQSATPQVRREIAAVSPERAPFLLAGALIIDGVLQRRGVTECVLSVRGLRYGFLD
jgi:exopolyphosphatase/guanosine-5'-triphosphate,3'-diphosphate pyrophosphatase